MFLKRLFPEQKILQRLFANGVITSCLLAELDIFLSIALKEGYCRYSDILVVVGSIIISLMLYFSENTF